MRVHLDKILCATDLTPYSNKALPYAAALASRFGSKLYVVHAVDLTATSAYDPSAFLVPDARTRLRQTALDEIGKLLVGTETKAEPLVLDGDPAMQIAEAAETLHADLIVAATHGRTGLRRMLLGSVTERLLHAARSPLLVVRSPEHEFVAATGHRLELRRILVGCDFSADSAHALEYGISLAQELEAELHLLHVIEPSAYRGLSQTATALAADLERSVEETVKGRLASLVPREAEAWCQVRTTCVPGSPHEEINKYARSHEIDLIVVGARGHSLVDTLLLGSTADRVVRRGPCPVLVARRLEGKA
jgi:nucleotide-binding universal stress UspA family protein